MAGLVSPISSGIGGGGFALVREGATGQVTILDFRETAPAGYDAAAAEREGAPAGMAVGVPGELAGLAELHRRWGRRSWRENVEVAAAMAEQGFAIPLHTARVLARLPKLLPGGGLSAQFAPGGTPLAAGAFARNPALGATLWKIAAQGPAGFYQGAVARSFVAAARTAGSPMTEQDLAGYKVMERKPLRARWGDRDIYTMPPPSAGGLLLLSTLGMFPPEEVKKLDPTQPEGAHLLAEIFRGWLADRFRGIGDPDRNSINLGVLLDPVRLSSRRKALDPQRTRTIEAFLQEDRGTSHFVIVDKDKNVVSLTTTVNSPWGARLYAEDIGVLLNDELNDFLPPSRATALGLPSAPGVGKPGARPPSSMMPTLVTREGQVELVAGGSGGMRIATSVTLVALGVLGGLGVEAAVKRPRVHVTPDGVLWLEPGGMSEEGKADLVRRGERVKEEEAMNAVQGVRLWPRVEAVADLRKFGEAALP
ncbi:MAG: gamma-glutamyltransferase [Myxococcales bacterium]|nr:gamma-glutamyltransferase family protein [Polyangiaceae bacterium]MDW8249334.1 gamma-glutamyltransferase [Myxococcales bacterium]